MALNITLGGALVGPAGPTGPSGGGGTAILTASDGSQWILSVLPNGQLQTNSYSSSGTYTDSFLTEDGQYYFVSEDSNNYLAQEA